MTGRTTPSSDERLAALHDKLITAVADLVHSDRWRQMLTTAARFPAYSPSNVLLIAAQRPDATRVGGIRTWNNLGRRVVKGERGIAILAPCTYRSTATDAESAGSEAEPAAARQKDADPVSMRELRGFRVVHVFDISQTDGPPLPEVEPRLLTGDAPQRLWAHLAGTVADDGFTLERGPCPPGANGYTAYRANTVRIRDDVEPAQATKTLAHELGHIRADHEHRFPNYASNTQCRGRAEVEAESIAYLVAATAGLDTTNYSLPYIAGWSQGRLDLLRESATQVLIAARSIGAPDEPDSRPGPGIPDLVLGDYRDFAPARADGLDHL
ncbi:ArdC-like ssDNA-binding domain-containing protein [uncultured Cellulomonas sp.]|uniref:ArdC-like ssDNA-binding domain-containing protein n=1 Tax=uncultured Cellulomonas sp. TaxID=189682 RepID=UPI0028E3C03E|nr:ArdC-like ssDNA-binding domain-containing protein [uncultured Cellulomonas sp.]